jgi:FkbM family methyltransferase
MAMWAERTHDALRRLGIDVIRFRPASHSLARRRSLFEAYQVDLVVDVGASDGEYATSLRRLGYRGEIVSFEPLPDVARRLRARHAGDARWRSYELALGSDSGFAELNVAGNSSSSSFLSMLPSHVEYAPESTNVGAATVALKTLDELAGDVIGGAQRPFLKIDTQGYEGRVLDGARTSIGRFVGVQVELSIIPLYEGAPLATEMIDRLQSEGLTLASIEPGFAEPVTGRLLQFDGVFFRVDRQAQRA